MGELERRQRHRIVADRLDIAIRILAIIAFLMLIFSLAYTTWIKL
jgi:hypothetical protein